MAYSLTPKLAHALEKLREIARADDLLLPSFEKMRKHLGHEYVSNTYRVLAALEERGHVHAEKISAGSRTRRFLTDAPVGHADGCIGCQFEAAEAREQIADREAA